MVQEEIKKIAEEFASMKNFTLGYHKEEHEMAKLFEQFIHFIQMRYCVVERSKVVEEYELSKRNIEKYDNDIIRHANHGALSVMKQLFGSETFNKKEDD